MRIPILHRFSAIQPQTLRGRLLLGHIPWLVGLIGLVGISLVALSKLDQANHELAHAGRELALTHQLNLRSHQVIGPFVAGFNGGDPVSDLATLQALVNELDQMFVSIESSYGEAEEHLLLQRAHESWKFVRPSLLNEPEFSLGRKLAEQPSELPEEVQSAIQNIWRDLNVLQDLVFLEVQQTELASQTARRLATRLLLFSALALGLLGICYILYIADYITRPLRALQVGVAQIGQGDLAYRLHLPHDDELGELADAFNTMAIRLQEHTNSLRTATIERTYYSLALRQVLNRTVKTEEAERERIARELHDGLSQWLVGALFEIQAARVRLPDCSTDAAPHLLEAQKMLKQIKTEMRRMIYDLHPPLLTTTGLVAAIQSYIQEVAVHRQIQCDFVVEGEIQRLLPEQELTLYRIVQESLTNIIKHAETNKAVITLSFSNDHICLTIVDQGRGFDMRLLDLDIQRVERLSSPQASHLGLLSMKERATAVGGYARVETQPRIGTRVTVVVPRTTPAPSHANTPLRELAQESRLPWTQFAS